MGIKTYLNASVRSGYLMKWSRMPIAVFIAPMKFYSKPGEDLEYRKLAVMALETWERASEGLLSFHVVDKLLNSQINIDWRRVDRVALGHCTYNYDNFFRLYGAEVSIGLTDGKIHQQYDSRAEVFHTLLHEIGHALGLGHSPYETDIMFSPHQYGVIELSENDIYSIQCLYCLPCGVTVREIAADCSVMTDRNIDMVIAELDEKYGNAGVGEDANDKTSNNPRAGKGKTRSLLDETSNIADIKKYHLMLQNTGLSGSMSKFFKNRQH